MNFYDFFRFVGSGSEGGAKTSYVFVCLRYFLLKLCFFRFVGSGSEGGTKTSYVFVCLRYFLLKPLRFLVFWASGGARGTTLEPSCRQAAPGPDQKTTHRSFGLHSGIHLVPKTDKYG